MLVCLESVPILAVAAERASVIKAMLATNSRGVALIYILTCLGVIAQLVSNGASALSPKWPLNTTMSAACVVV